MKNRSLAIYLILVSIWWGWTVLIDMFVIRTVFSVISNFFQAGDLGIAVFSKLNNLEVIVSSILIGLVALKTTKNKKLFKFLIPVVLSWLIVMGYFIYLTPKLIELTEMWKLADAKGSVAINGIADIQQAHQLYHNIYIGLDVVKLTLLTLMLGLGLFKDKEWKCES